MPTSPIRVLFVLGSLASGGSERQVVEILKRLDRKRFIPRLYTVSPGGELESELPEDVPDYSFWGTHTYPVINVPGLIRHWQIRDLAAHLAREQIDIVYDRNFQNTLFAAAACRLRPTRRISVISSDPNSDLAENSGRFGALKKWYLKRAYASADRVVAVSNGVAEAVRRYYDLAPGQVITIYNSVDDERLERLSAEFEAPFEPDRFHIVAIGRLVPPKGYSYLLEAIDELVHHRKLSQIKLWLVGGGPLKEQLETFIRDRELGDFVTLTGQQLNPIPYLKRAHLFCLSSVYEGMPNAVLEAALCEVPILATDCRSGPAEILEDGKLGRLVPPANSKALAEAISDAIANYEVWRGLTAQTRSRVLQRFSPAANLAALESLFLEVMEKRK